MINRVIISGVLQNDNVELEEIEIGTKKVKKCSAYLLTQNSRHDSFKPISFVVYGDIAVDLYENQNTYRDYICMYYGEIVYSKTMQSTFIKVNEKPHILVKLL